jgi:hypothetical protein
VENKYWKLIKLARGAPKFAHLAFRDDLLLFAEADIEQTTILTLLYIDLFSRSSGQKVSTEMNQIWSKPLS